MTLRLSTTRLLSLLVRRHEILFRRGIEIRLPTARRARAAPPTSELQPSDSLLSGVRCRRSGLSAPGRSASGSNSGTCLVNGMSYSTGLEFWRLHLAALASERRHPPSQVTPVATSHLDAETPSEPPLTLIRHSATIL